MTKLAPSKQTAAKTIYAAFKILKENGNQLPGKDVVEKISETVELSEWEKVRYEKTGYIRWESILHFYTINCMKAGLLRKNRGIWYLTPEGVEALKLSEEKLLQKIIDAYKTWQLENKKSDIDDDETVEEESDIQDLTLTQKEEEALEGLKKYIYAKNPYEFQDLVAALLRGMGYFTPFVAPKGKDGGIDIIAYQDPLGAKNPRIKLQVKHRPDTKATAKEIKQLMGVLSKEGEIAIFVASGGFTSDATQFTRDSHTHVELIDINKFINLWIDFYEKMTDEDKSMLPLKPIYFLAPNE
ncbi:MAG: Mrr restriction system protein [Spirochaetia bacterium]|nr:Mrr restriction system protein [Spirochaetia bacterium]